MGLLPARRRRPERVCEVRRPAGNRRRVEPRHEAQDDKTAA